MSDRSAPPTIEWVVLTMGDRPEAVAAAVSSLRVGGATVRLVANGVDAASVAQAAGLEVEAVVASEENLGVPGGRDLGVAHTTSDLVGFLDDDAVLLDPERSMRRIVETFASDATLGAVGLRLVDDEGETSARHVPRVGGGSADVAGEVVTFLGGASVVRRRAYDEAGGYFGDLFYGHEELELSWRLHDAGWRVRYVADVLVRHPRTPIGRHERGWWLTGRNRVWIVRRSLPASVGAVHTLVWLALGVVRAPSGCRRAYVDGWLAGWRTRWSSNVERRPIRWRTVRRLAALGRPPMI